MNTPSIIKALACSAGLKLVSPAKLTGFEGKKVGKRTGNALEFAEYRDYQPGDDIRRLDWGVFARQEQLMVRQFNEEVEPRCDIILDCSASMAFPASKAEAAMGLAALLALAASNAAFTLALWQAKEEWRMVEKPELPLEWQMIEMDSPRSPGETIDAFTGRFKPHGIRIVISDFLWSLPPANFIKRIQEGAQKTWLLRLDIPLQLTSDNLGAVTITDAETGEQKECVLDESLVEKYNQRRYNHLEQWSHEAERLGVELLDIPQAELEKNLASEFLVEHNLLTC